MKACVHLTYGAGDHMAFPRLVGLNPAVIVCEIGQPACTVGRELKRNCNCDGAYRPVATEGRCFARRQRLRILDSKPRFTNFIVKRLYEGWTPEQDSSWLPAGNERLPSINFESNYDWIYCPTQRSNMANFNWRMFCVSSSRVA